MSEPVVFRPRFGQGLTIGIVAIAVLMVIVAAVSDGILTLVMFIAPIALVCFSTFALFWAPNVTVSDGGVALRNVLRTVELPWPSITDIETRYALTLVTMFGRYTAWAAPAPGRHSALRTGFDTHALPPAVVASGSMRPGDDLSTDSGQAATIVRRRWEELQRAGHLDDARLETDRPRVRWHVNTIAALVGLSAITAATTLLS